MVWSKINPKRKFSTFHIIIVVSILVVYWLHGKINHRIKLQDAKYLSDLNYWKYKFFLNESYKQEEQQNVETIRKVQMENDAESACKFPAVVSRGHFMVDAPRECNLKKNWGDVDRVTRVWHFDPDIRKRYKNIDCTYRPVERVDDFEVKFGATLRLFEGTRLSDEVFEVECSGVNKKSKETENFKNLYVQIVSKLDERLEGQWPDPHRPDENMCRPMNVMLLSYDSVSKLSWLNRLFKTNRFIENEMKFDILNGYNILGDGTPAALIPIYTGRTEEELPSVLKNDPKARYVDEAYPFIWKELHEKNYTSIFIDDCPRISAFNYRMKGFKNHVTTHYYKHYQLRLWDQIKSLRDQKLDDFCVGAKKRHKVILDLLSDFKRIYQNKKANIAIMHYVENSHNSNKKFNWLDDELFEFLSTGHANNLFTNTAIFLYSDHGTRFNEKPSESRYIEERMPFVSLYLPPEYKQVHPDKYAYLRGNLNRLTSPFDIYATVRDLTCLDSGQKVTHPKLRRRNISLLSEISPKRSCEDIGIPDHYCVCIKPWQLINSTIVQAIVQFTINSINKLTSSARGLCHILGLKKLITAELLDKPYGDQLYRISFVTNPNQGIYETIVYSGLRNNFEFKSANFSIKSRHEISRIDAYGEQPHCVANFANNPAHMLDLRKFCYCKPKSRGFHGFKRRRF